MVPPPSATASRRLQRAIETRFECTRCGRCCKGDGLVHLGPEEVDRIAARLGMTRTAFVAAYACPAGVRRWVLRDKWVPVPEAPPTADGRPLEQWCVFLERDPDGLYRCAVQDVKPDQCRGFPARWRNPDSLSTCEGLARLVEVLDAEWAAASP